MPKGEDTRDHPSRRPRKLFRAYQHLDPTEDIGNVVWVNFKNPMDFHPKVYEYLTNVANEQATSNSEKDK